MNVIHAVHFNINKPNKLSKILWLNQKGSISFFLFNV